MPSKTLSGTYSSYALTIDSYTLTNLGTIGSGTVNVGFTISGTADTVVNAGTIAGSNYGITASQGLSLTIQSSGTLNARVGYALVVKAAAGTVVNAGTIFGERYGIRLLAGGAVTNQSGGTISGFDGSGILVRGGTGTIDNAGGITSVGFDAIDLLGGGGVTNRVGATIASGANFGVYMSGAAGAVINAGTISASGNAIYLKAGGTVTNQSGAAISTTREDAIRVVGGAGAADNAGAIGGYLIGVYLGGGGAVTNQSGGTITATSAVEITGASGKVSNVGGILGSSLGVLLAAGGVVTNQSGGTISAHLGNAVVVEAAAGTVVNGGAIVGENYGIYLRAGGAVTNQNGGTISGFIGSGILVRGDTGTVDNAGDITSAEFIGVALLDGGGITNRIGATIAGGLNVGIYVSGTAGTVINAGVISGAGEAVKFVAGHTDLLVVAPGASFIGTVNGGNTPGATAISTLELASGSAAGTLSGLGSQYVDFARLAIDSGATWTVTGTSALVAAVTLAGAVTLTNSATLGGAAVAIGLTAADAANTVVNAGRFTGASYGIYANQGLNLTNQVTGMISGAGSGVGVQGCPGTVINAGDIAGTSYQGLILGDGGRVANYSDGTISASGVGVGGRGIVVEGDTGTVGNAGTISGGQIGVFLDAGGTVSNQVGGTIRGTTVYGVLIGSADGTLVNAGTIYGGTDAVKFDAGYPDRLIVDPGAVFSGTVDGGNAPGGSYLSTLELAAGASAGTMSGLGSQYVDFSDITVDVSAVWTLTGTNSLASGVTLIDAGTLTAASLIGAGIAAIRTGATLDVQGTIAGGETIAFDGSPGLLALGAPGSVAGAVTGFAVGDTIDLAGVDPASVHYASGDLEFFAGGTAASFALVAGGGAVSAVTDHNGGTLVSALCFCAGTRIMTPSGEVAVEHLSVGDLVVTASGVLRPLVWIGTGQVMVTRGRRSAATPVIVRKGALADNVPNRDLHITKGHSLLIDRVLIPVEFLVNHRSIQWDDHVREARIYHLELASHDVLLANGAPAESYRDDGNRWLFENANTGWEQPPKPPCAPVLTGGPVVDAIWWRLLHRTGARPGVPLTNDPDLHVLVDGLRVNSAVARNGRYVFHSLQAGAEIRLVSRAGSPAELGLSRDPRVLGVAIRQIRLWQGARLHVMNADDDALEDGFHSYEADNDFRWTDGYALAPARLFGDLDGACDLDLLVKCTGRYLLCSKAA